MFVLLISCGLIFGVLFGHFETQIMKELESEATYIAHALEKEGLSYFSDFFEHKKRITLISEDGTVLADTLAEPEQLDNHADRKEIKEAMKFGSGTSARYSATLLQKTLYYALLLEDGSILRISTTQNSVVNILLSLVQPIAIIVMVAAVVSFFLSQKVSQSIIKPINALNLENPEGNETYEELTPLLKKLSAQNKTIAEQLREAERKQEEFRLITENMREGLLVIDLNAQVLSYNQAALHLLGLDTVQSGSVLHFNRTKGFRMLIEQALAGERAENALVMDEHTYNLIANPVYEEEKILGAVIVILDVTEQVKREQLRREFTSNVSHELKTPLTSISGFAEMMKAGGTPEEMVVDFSTSIYEEAQRLIALVGDIMKISALDEKTMYDIETVDLYEIATGIALRLKPIAQKRGIEINVIGESACIQGTRSILEELVYNLCDNAIKYNKENGTVDIVINTTEKKVNLLVRDTGIGIPQTEQHRVFERFYRVDKSHSRLIGGTGLGLAIVKHAAMYHSAELKLESAENKGTTVFVSFQR